LEPDAAAAGQQILSTVAQSFQQTLGVIMQQIGAQATQNVQVVAQTVAHAVNAAAAETREHDMRLMLQLQRETIEQAHDKELKRLAKEQADAEQKRQRTEGAEDL
jgi:hypothetical protein